MKWTACWAATATGERLRIGQSNVLRRQDDDAARDKERVFASLDHPHQPVDCRVGVGVAHRLDEGGDSVVVGIARLVVGGSAALEHLLHQRAVDAARSVFAGLGGLRGQFDGVERHARVAARDDEQQFPRGLVEMRVGGADAALLVRQRPLGEGAHLVVRQRLELEDARPRQEGRVHFEGGVLGGRADEDHRAVLDVGQDDILLRLVEAVHLVHEEDGAALLHPPALAGVGDGLAQVGDAGGDGGEGGESGAGGGGDEQGERGLARAGRPPQHHRGYGVGADGALQHAAGAEDVLLADELVERAGGACGRRAARWRLSAAAPRAQRAMRRAAASP